MPNVAAARSSRSRALAVFRPLVGIALITRTPSLYNAVPNPVFTSFNENMPLRNLPIVTDTVPGASAIQTRSTSRSGLSSPGIRRPMLRSSAADHHAVRARRHDRAEPDDERDSPCGRARRRATLFRNDSRTRGGDEAEPAHVPDERHAAPGALFAIEAQQQIATFFASDGKTTIDPDGPGPYFETPTSIVPEDLGFMP